MDKIKVTNTSENSQLVLLSGSKLIYINSGETVELESKYFQVVNNTAISSFTWEE